MSEIVQEDNLSGMYFSKKINTDNVGTRTQGDISKTIEKIEKMNEERVAKMVDELSSITEATIQKIESLNEERETKIAKSISNMTEAAIKKIQQMNEEMESKRDFTIWEERLVEWKKLY